MVAKGGEEPRETQPRLVQVIDPRRRLPYPEEYDEWHAREEEAFGNAQAVKSRHQAVGLAADGILQDVKELRGTHT